LKNIIIPAGVASIENSMFASCATMTNVIIPNTVTNIGNSAFSSCSSLKSAAIPNGVIRIGSSAFNTCINLTEAVFPDTVTSIGSLAYSSCYRITNVVIGQGVADIGSGAFSACSGLKFFTVDASNQAYCSINGVIYDINQTTLIAFPAGKAGTYTVPSTIASLANYAFYYCNNLVGIYFQGNQPTLGGSSVFTGDNNTTIYFLPNSVGWGSALAGVTNVLWNPHVQTTDVSFGVLTNQFCFTITGSSNILVITEAATNLFNPDWQPVQTNTLTTGSAYFSDPQWTNYPARFYRLRWP
jgi:hypothetical protein